MLRQIMLAATAATSFSGPALAADISGLDALKTWNLIVLGDLSSNSNVEGRAFVGGDLTGGSGNFFTKGNTLTSSNWPGLTVVGDVSGATKNLNNSSGAYIGGSLNSGFNLNGNAQIISIGGDAKNFNASSGSTVKVGGNLTNFNANNASSVAVGGNMSNVNLSSNTSYQLGGTASNLNKNGATLVPGAPGAVFQQPLSSTGTLLTTSLQNLSSDLSKLKSTDSFSLSGSRAVFNAVGNDSLSVFNLTSDNFKDFKEIEFHAKGLDTVIVNVSGKNLTFNDNFVNSDSGLGTNVIWNFYEATKLTFSTAFQGTVLAPFAAATVQNSITGTAAFASLNQQGAIQLDGFNGSLGQVSAPALGVPEPRTWLQMLAGFALVGLFLRYSRRKAAHAF